MPTPAPATDARRGARRKWDDWVEQAIVARVDIARLIPLAGWRLPLALVLMNLASGAVPVAFVIATSLVIGRVPAAVTAGVESAAWDSLVRAFIAAAAVFLGAQIMAPFVTALNSRLRRRIDGSLRDHVLELAHRTTSIGPMEDQDVLNELSEASSQLDTEWNTPGQAAGGLLALIARYVSLVGFCTLLSLASFWWAGPVMLASTMTFRVVNRGGLRRFSAAWRTILPASRRRGYLRELAVGDVAAKETRIFGINGWLADRYSRTFWEMYGPVGIARRKIVFAPYLPVTIVGVAATGWVVYSVGQGAVTGALTLTALALALQAVMGAVALGQEFEEADVPTQFGMRAMEAMRMLRRYLDAAEAREREHTAANVMADDPAGLDPAGLDPAPLAAAKLNPAPIDPAAIRALPSAFLEFRDIAFGYPGSDGPVLEGLNLRIPAGRSTAIVGVNGAGKTTLVKLLTRLYEPTAGVIVADRIDVGRIDAAAWRRQVSVIFQDFTRYEFSAAENIAVGAMHSPRDDAAITEAARKAGILDAFAELPHGLDTILARTYTDGIELSGGQWQRIAIARSLYALHQGAKILVLDEPTSALDVRAEAAFFDQFVELTQGVTSILISHRFSSVRRADHIVVLDGGRVSAQGSHEELMEAGGHYADLFHLQADRFARGLDAEGEIVDEVTR